MIKDRKTKAVLSTDAEALNKYKLERSQYRKVEKMQNDIIEIKRCISSICEKIDKIESR